jgi:alcohol dehydrogenase YqhD (iron-dependent ADH family)
VRHRVASVDGEIDDDLLELGGIDPNPAVLGVEVQLDLDVVADERPGLE